MRQTINLFIVTCAALCVGCTRTQEVANREELAVNVQAEQTQIVDASDEAVTTETAQTDSSTEEYSITTTIVEEYDTLGRLTARKQSVKETGKHKQVNVLAASITKTRSTTRENSSTNGIINASKKTAYNAKKTANKRPWYLSVIYASCIIAVLLALIYYIYTHTRARGAINTIINLLKKLR